ncbi:MAG: LicD family protein [Lachnospiraceae bacterium]|nr:LicD family protein [Lachnospiraceae bacterium]
MDSKLHRITDEELKGLQNIELEMLIEIDRVCKKADIKYSLDGGTLLGAVRHKGFIPWDDDSDVIFLRSEYERFRKICKTELDTDRFFLQDYITDPNYRWGYAKLRRNHTSFVRSGQEDQQYRDGIYLDIFVVDNVPDGWLARRLHYFACFVIRKGLYSAVGKNNEKNPVIRGVYRLMNHISKDSYFKMRNKLADALSKKRTELISHYMYPYPQRCKYGLPRECFDEMIDTEYEGYQLRVFKDYDLYLTRLYGDYMELPPVEDRVPKLEISSIVLAEPRLS